MPRRADIKPRQLPRDPVYNSVLVTQLINKVMLHGKRSIAEKIVYDAMKLIAAKIGDEPLDTVKRAVENVKPALEVKSRRVGGATYQVPVEVPARRARTLAVRWLVQFARARREKSMAERLANEMLDATQQQGGAWKRKDDIYRMAQANKAFAHYRW